VGDQLRSGGRTIAQTKHQHLAMSGTATLQFSLAFVLLTSAGLPVRSLIKASETNPGIPAQARCQSADFLTGYDYNKSALVVSLFDRLLA
jgi:hypothetical protein